MRALNLLSCVVCCLFQTHSTSLFTIPSHSRCAFYIVLFCVFCAGCSAVHCVCVRATSHPHAFYGSRLFPTRVGDSRSMCSESSVPLHTFLLASSLSLYTSYPYSTGSGVQSFTHFPSYFLFPVTLAPSLKSRSVALFRLTW